MGADSVVSGPPAAAQCFGTEGLILDKKNNNLYIFGDSRTPQLLAGGGTVVGPQTALTAITTAQTLLSKTFAAGALNYVGATVQVSGSLIYSTTTANVATITLAVLLGAVSLASITTAATNTTASTNLPINFSFTLTVVSIGAAGTLVAVGNVNANIGTTAAAATANYASTNTGVSSAVNLLIAEILTVTIAASAAIPSATLLSATVQQIA